MAKSGPSRRGRTEGGRPHVVKVTFGTVEMTLVSAAAARADKAVAAWLGEAGVREARATSTALTAWEPVLIGLMARRAELMDARGVLRNVGGNLNQVAKVANSTGQLDASTAEVLALVARVVARVDDAVAEIGAFASEVAVEVQRSRR